MARADNPKLLMIGIDAGDVDFIQSSLDRLPRLRQLFEGGSILRLDSTAGHLPGSVWPTFSTATLPGEHGIYQHIQWDSSGMKLRRLTTDWIDFQPFWSEAARQGVRSTVIDVPFSFPTRWAQNVEVMNWGSHDLVGPYGSNPPELAREIRRRFGKHPMGYEIPVEKTPAQLDQIREEIAAGARRKGEVSRWLLETTEWDFFLTVFGECHRGGHILWPYPDDQESGVPPDALLEVYQSVDQAVSHILDGVDLNTTTVIVFSLHGMTENLSQEHFVRPVMDRINAGFEEEGSGQPETSQPKRGLVRMLREAVPARLQHAIAMSVPVGVRDWVVEQWITGGIAWDQTLGFALRSDLTGYLRFNLIGREAKGVLEKGSDLHHRYETWVKESFSGLKVAGTETPIVKDVMSLADVYPGPKNDILPDLIVSWEDLEPAQEIVSARLGRFSTSLAPGRGGNHQPTGFAVMAGNQQPVEQAPPIRHIVDLAQFVRNFLMQAGNA
jgi:predicted AlkP superfamily phosphohydrolase/phosphomutase